MHNEFYVELCDKCSLYKMFVQIVMLPWILSVNIDALYSTICIKDESYDFFFFSVAPFIFKITYGIYLLGLWYDRNLGIVGVLKSNIKQVALFEALTTSFATS